MWLSVYPEKENYEDTCRVWNTLGCFNAVPQLCSVHVAYANDRNSVVTLSMHPTVFPTKHVKSISYLIRLKSLRNSIWQMYDKHLTTCGFWPRVRARALRAPVFFRLINMQNGALRAPPPIAASLLLIYTPKLSLRPELGQSGVVYLSIGLSCTFLSYIASYWATLVHPKSYAAPSELSWILLSYVAPFWATLDPIYSKLSCAL